MLREWGSRGLFRRVAKDWLNTTERRQTTLMHREPMTARRKLNREAHWVQILQFPKITGPRRTQLRKLARMIARTSGEIREVTALHPPTGDLQQPTICRIPMRATVMGYRVKRTRRTRLNITELRKSTVRRLQMTGHGTKQQINALLARAGLG